MNDHRALRLARERKAKQAQEAVKQLQKELLNVDHQLLADWGITVRPLPENILEWHYVMHGAGETPYQEGTYHGKLLFSKEYPQMPPKVLMMTPTGRIALHEAMAFLEFDDGNCWNPEWTITGVLFSVFFFLHNQEDGICAIRATDPVRRAHARNSRDFNLRDPVFRKLFPELAEELYQRQQAEIQASFPGVPLQQFINGPPF